tara:strand:+ start:1694 stop:2113 length:420 start_codon:yes stop_codon:yes gene_type:complete
VRLLLPKIISDEEAQSLRSTVGYLEWDDDRLSSILPLIRGSCSAHLDDPAYVRVEEKKEGHPWHIDTGNNGHMAWCKFSARLLLNPEDDFSSGAFHFIDDPLHPIFGYRDLLIYDHVPENEHRIAAHKGQRRVLLMFFT